MTAEPATTISVPAPEFTEAPAVVFTQLYGSKEGQVVQINLTVRAGSGSAAIDELIASIKYAQEKYHFTTTRPDVRPAPAAAPAPAPAAPLPASAASAPAPIMPPPAAPAPAGGFPGVPAEQKIRAVKMEVTPNANGKVTLKWYSAGHNFPDITTTRTTEKALELLAASGPWFADHLARAATYQVSHLVIWRASEKLNTQGKPYKDIVSLTPAA